MVFGRIDRAMKGYYLGARAETLATGMPPGVIVSGDRWVRSVPVVPPGSDSSLLIRGRVDVLVECDDETAAVVDFKTVVPGTANTEKYSRQLHSYALALEHPAKGPAVTVGSMGLLCFDPTSYRTQNSVGALTGPISWVEVERDDATFFGFLTEVLGVLEEPDGPRASPGCPWCAWEAGTDVAA